jgi:hypothetical protein
MKIKIDKADTQFSYYIRLRDKRCVRCGSQVRFNIGGYPNSHENSHYQSRGHEATRFDPENCDTLCYACHANWGSRDKEGYRNFKIKQLGQEGFDALILRSNQRFKKDRELQYFIWKNKVNEILGLPPYKMREKKVKKRKPKSIKVKKEKTISQKQWEEKCKQARKESYKKWKDNLKSNKS